MRLEFSAYVEADLDDIAAYIAADNPRRAVRFIDEITALFTVIADHPQLYRLRLEIRPDVRLVAHGNYVILFRILGDSASIERVVHGSRNLIVLFGLQKPQGSG